MAHQAIWPKIEGSLIGSLPTITQGSTLETITILALYSDGTAVNLTGKAMTATMRDGDDVYSVTGTLTGGNGSFTWKLSAGDIGTDGGYSTIFTYSDGSESWSSDPAWFVIRANPSATAVQNPALVQISAAEAAWVAVAKGEVSDPTTLATDSTVATAVTNHNVDTTSVHGIADTSLVATSSQIVAVTVPTVTAGGVVDNAASIQSAIDALPAAGGIVHIPAGTYKVSAHCLEIISTDGCILQGAGIGVTILDFSGTPDIPSHTDRGAFSRGAVTIDTANRVTVRDLTIKMPATGSETSLKALYVKESNNVTIDHVEIDGSVYEAIYCEGSAGRVNYRVTNCVIHDHDMTAIDINTVDGDGQYIQNNYIYNGGSGIACRGERSVVTGNIIKNCVGMGIALYHEASGVYHLDDVIANNIITAIGSGGGLTARGIYTYVSTYTDEGGVLVQGNVISGIIQESGKTCHGIYAAGAVSVIANTIRGTTGTGATTVAIETQALYTRAYVASNVVEPVSTDEQRWQYGLFCSGNGNAIFQNNIVYADAVGDGVNIAFRDSSGAAILQGNILQGSIVYGGTTFNGTASLDLALIGTKMVVGLLGTNERLPMTANIIMLTKYYIPWNVGTGVAITDGNMAHGVADLYGAVIGDTVMVACTDSTAVPGGVIFSGQVTAANVVTITCYNKSGANYTPPYAAGKYRLCAFR